MTSKLHRSGRMLMLFGADEDYLSDGLFHGLRTLLGDAVVDYPKRDFLYETCPPADLRRLREGGFSLYGLLPDVPVNRQNVFQRMSAGEFDVVIIGDIWRDSGAFSYVLDRVSSERLIVLDGSDGPSLYPYAKARLRGRARAVPRPVRGHLYYKRELTPLSASSRFYRGLPGRLATALWHPDSLRPIAFSIPREKLIASVGTERSRTFPSHIVDDKVAGLVGASTSYVHASEESYYADLSIARFGVTTKRAGWDCLRHYELAARGCVLCFRDLDQKPTNCAHHGLDRGNTIIYRGADDLLRQVENLPERRYEELQLATRTWIEANTTVARASSFLSGIDFA